MSKRRIMFVSGVAISCVGLYWAMKGVRWGEVAHAFSSPRLYLWSVPFVILTLINMWLRGVRTYYLLRHEAALEQWPLFKITMIGFAYNCILPMRAGEFIRAYLFGKEKGLGFTKAAASLVVERIYDLAMILLCFVGALMSVNIATELTVDVFGFQLKGAAIEPLTRKLVILCLILMVGVCFMLFSRTRALVLQVIRLLPLCPHLLKERLFALVESFASGLRSVRDPGAVAASLVLSFLVWLSIAVSVWVLQFGFSEMGPVSMSQSFAIMIFICFAVMLPSGPAYFGMYEAGGVFALLVLGIVREDQKSLALSFTLALHFLQVIPITILGLAFALKDHISVKAMETGSGLEGCEPAIAKR